MVSDEVNIIITVDNTEAERELAEFEAEVNKLGSVWQRTKQKIKSEVRGVIGTMQAVTTVFVNMLKQFGIALDPVQTAIVTAIQTTLASILATHRALEASTFGIAGVATVALSAVAIGISVSNIAATALGMEEAQRSMAQSQVTANSVVGLINSLSWV